MRIFPIIKKVVQEVGGGAGFVASVVNAGIQLTNRFELLGGEVNAGVSVDATRQAARIPQTPGVAVTALGVTGTLGQKEATPGVSTVASLRDVAASNTPQTPAVEVAASLRDIAATSAQQKPAVATSLLGVTGTLGQQQASPAIAMGARISEHNTPQMPAGRIVQVSADLTKRAGANASANVSGTWTNLANAQGIHDGSSATSAGAVTGASRKLRLDYANSVNKSALTITAFRLHVYAAVTGDTTGLLSTTTISYNIGGGEQTLEVIAGNFSNITTPRTYDLFALGATTWTHFDAVQSFVNHAYSATSVGVSCAVDAIEVEVIANNPNIIA